MFTGIVEELGTITRVDATAVGPDEASRIAIEASVVTAGAEPGDSIAVSGVCLTVVEVGIGSFCADVMRETLLRTSLNGARVGGRVNLERAATLQTRLGGHLVQGHIDGTGRVLAREHTPQWDVVRIEVPLALSRYVVEKGSIAVDGVSLTVVAADDFAFTVSLIPTTLQRTTLGLVQPGDLVNLEVDIMAKYVERLLEARLSGTVSDR